MCYKGVPLETSRRKQRGVMALNFTGIDGGLYYSINSAVNVGLFFFAVLPTLILCLLCVLALFYADSINWKIRVLFINIFAGDICLWLALTILFLGYPVRQITLSVFSCAVSFSLLIVTGLQKFMSTSLYAIAVYIFLKHGINRLKWYFIIPYLVISWIVSIAIASSVYVSGFSSFSDAFCDIAQAPFSTVPIVSVQVLALIFLCIIIVFSILTYCYVKNNILEDDVEVKKAVTKIMLFLFILSLVSFFANVLPSSSLFIKAEKMLVIVILFNYIFRVLLNLISIATPIVMIIILKPLRLAMKKVFECMCCCGRTNEENRGPVSELTTRATNVLPDVES